MREQYGSKFYENMKATLRLLEDNAEDPVRVVDAVEEALLSKNPKHRQLVGTFLHTIFAKVPAWAVDSIIQKVYMRGINPMPSKL